MNEYSMFFGDDQKLGTSFDGAKPSSGAFDTKQPISEPLVSPEAAKAFYQGSQAGGTGAGVMNMGLMTGNPALAVGGGMLSYVEAKKKSEQAAEEQRVKQEEDMKKQQLAAINTAIGVSRGLTV